MALVNLVIAFSIVERRPLGVKSGAENANRRCLHGRSRSAVDAELGRAFSRPAPPAAWGPSLHKLIIHGSSPAIHRTVPNLIGSSRGSGDLTGSIYLTLVAMEGVLPRPICRSPVAIRRCAHCNARREISDIANAALPMAVRQGQTTAKFEGGTSRLGRAARA